ncbi:hypothetical protein Tco_0233104 [Tanacetum coccineum]
MFGDCSCSCVDGILVDGASWSTKVDTSESAKSIAHGIAATSTGETELVGGLKSHMLRNRVGDEMIA